MEQPLITVITVCYNCASALEKTILSVINQKYKKLEYIIIDGGSTDGTQQVIQKYSPYISTWLSESDGGVYWGMNKGIALATGEWINFMNAGDTFVSDTVLHDCFYSKLYDIRTKLICGDTICSFPWGKYFRKGKNPDGTLNFCHQSVFSRTSALKKTPYDTSYKIIADNIWYNHLKINEKAYIPVSVSVYEGYNGISAKNDVNFYRELCRYNNIPHDFRWELSMIKLRLKLWFRSLLPTTIKDKQWKKKLDKTLVRLD